MELKHLPKQATEYLTLERDETYTEQSKYEIVTP